MSRSLRRVILAGVAAALLLAGCSSGTTQSAVSPAPAQPDSPGTAGTSSHDNIVAFVISGSGISSLAFVPDGGYSITSGQPWGGVTGFNVTAPGWGNITAVAGRSGSKGPADWLKSVASPMICSSSGSCPATPSDLNFAFTGTLTINGTPYKAGIGQGHSVDVNNWWIGGSGWQRSTGKLVTPDSLYKIEGQSGASNEFEVSTN